MKNIKYASILIAFAVCGVLLSTKLAHAYLDPGTGSAILQGLIAAIAAVGIVVKLYWHRILRLLGLKKENPPSINMKSKEDK